MMKTYIQNFCNEHKYPQDSTHFLLESYTKITECESVNELFSNYLISYEKDGIACYMEALQKLEETASLCDVPYYTIHFLYCICLTKELKRRYELHNIPEHICYDTIHDLKYKLVECHKVHGIWGTFVASWWRILFDLRLYALGRLEYEVWTSTIDYHKNGNDINPGDTIIQVHIPSSGPLIHEECLTSYQMAKEFFKSLFVGRKTYFMCHSWLLFPDHKKFLNPNSNIRKFADDFEMYSYEYNDGSEDLWRIFDVELKTETISDFGEPKTSLQKAYIEWLKQGNKTGSGIGLIIL